MNFSFSIIFLTFLPESFFPKHVMLFLAAVSNKGLTLVAMVIYLGCSVCPSNISKCDYHFFSRSQAASLGTHSLEYEGKDEHDLELCDTFLIIFNLMMPAAPQNCLEHDYLGGNSLGYSKSNFSEKNYRN